MSTIDFSKKKDVLIRNPEGDIQPICQPYFRPTKIAAGTWQILGDGVNSYLIEGENEGLVIDPGCGSGDMRAFCEQIIGKPVRKAANTTYELYHTAANCNFEVVYASEKALKATPRALPSMEGVIIPHDYKTEIIEDGSVIDLGGREIVAYSFDSATDGGMIFFDKKNKIFFVGDEISDFYVPCDYMSVADMKERLQRFEPLQGEIDMVCGSYTIFYSYFIKRLILNADRILKGEHGVPMIPGEEPYEPEKTKCGKTVYNRMGIRPEDHVVEDPVKLQNTYFSHVAECKIVYDSRMNNF